MDGSYVIIFYWFVSISKKNVFHIAIFMKVIKQDLEESQIFWVHFFPRVFQS